MKSILRLVLVAAGFTVATAAFSHAASETGSTAGMTLYGQSSLNARILGNLADRSFRIESSQAGPGAPGRTRMSDSVIDLARASFAVDPLEVTSLRTIALGEVLPDDKDRARRAMRLAARISKRDAVTDLWLAQDYGEAGNMEGMLAAFDQALRASIPARDFAMKPLVETLRAEDSYVPLGRLLARHPEWEVEFWREFYGNPIALAHADEFFSAGQITMTHISVEGRSRIYSGLRKAGAFASIRRLAEQDPQAKVGDDDLVVGKFVTVDEGNPFGWTMYSQGRFATQVSRGQRDLVIDAASGAFGRAAVRVAGVSGNQELVIALADPLPDYATLELSAKCADVGGGELTNIRLEGGDKGGDAVLATGDCNFVSLTLSFTVEPGRRDASIRVARVALRPA